MSAISLLNRAEKTSRKFSIFKILTMMALAFGMMILAAPAHAPSWATSAIQQSYTQPSTLTINPSVLPDFSIQSDPASLSMAPGTTQTVQIKVTSLNGFSGPIYLVTFSYPLVVSLSSSTLTLTSPGSASTTLIVKVPAGIGQETDSVQVGATGGCGLIHYTSIPVTVNGPDFTVTPEKTKLTVSSTVSDTTTVDLASLNGFSGTIILSTPLSFEFGISPSAVSLTSGQAKTVSLTVQLGIFAPPPGNYTLLVDADSGLISHHFDLSVIVAGSTYSLTAEKESITVLQGGSNSTLINITPIETFSGTVMLANSSYTPGLSLSLDTTSVTLPPSAQATLSVKANATATLGLSYVIVTGTNATLTQPGITQSVIIQVIVKPSDFLITVDPEFLTLIVSGSSCSTIVNVNGVNGFTGTVTLTEKHDPGLTVTIANPSFQIPGSSGLNVQADAGVTPGFHSIDINATVGTVVHDTMLNLYVIGPDFEIMASPNSVIAVAGGAQNSSAISLNPLNGFAGTVKLEAISSDPSITATLLPSTISTGSPSTLTVTVAPGTLPGGFYYVEVNATSGSLNHPIFVQVTVEGPDFSLSADHLSITFNAGSTNSSTITLTPIRGFSEFVDFSATSSSTNLNATILPATVSSSDYSTVLHVNSTIPGQYSIYVVAMSSPSGTSHYLLFSVTVYAPDFAITATTPLSVPGNGTAIATSTIVLTSEHGFSGTVNLSDDSASVGISCLQINPTTAIGGSGTAKLQCTSATPGQYSVTITGSSDGLHHDTTVTFTFSKPDFQISATTPSSVVANGTTTTESIIRVTFTNGFSGTVTLSDSPLPSGLVCSDISPLTLDHNGTATLSCKSSTAGSYPVHITGTKGSTSHVADVTFTFTSATQPGFKVSSSQSSLSIQQGSSGTTTITVTPSGGFSGTVSLTAEVSPTGPTTSFSNPSIISGSGTSTLTINVGNSVNTGTYMVKVTGGSGSQTQTTTITVTVTAPQPAATNPGNSTLVYIIVGIVIAAIAVGGGALYLRSKKPSKPAKPGKTP